MIYIKSLINGSEFIDYKQINLNKSSGDSNTISTAELVFDSPYGRHKNSFNVGENIQIYAAKDNLIYNGGSPAIQFRFNNSGTNIVDSISGLIGSQTNPGGASFVEGVIGSAVNLSGTTYFNCFDVPISNVNEGSQFSVCLWANISGVWNSNATQGLFGRGSTSSCRWAIDTVSGTRANYRFGTRSGTAAYTITFPEVNRNEWHHLAGTYNGSNMLFGYMDGVFIGSRFTNGSRFNILNGSVFVGRNTAINGNIGSNVVVTLDDARFYDKMLSGEDVSAIYNLGSGNEEISPNNRLIFNGILEKVKFQGEETTQECIISGRDYGLRLQDLTVQPIIFTNQEISDIVKNILSNNNVPDITTTNVQTTGKTLARIGFNHLSIFDALNQLAGLCGFVWYVDNNKDLHFEPESSVDSGVVLDNSNIIESSYDQSRQGMANQVWVYGDRYLSEAPTEVFTFGSPVGMSGVTLNYKPHNTRVSVLGSVLKGSVLGMMSTPMSGDNYGVSFDDRQIVFYSGTNIGYSSIPGSGGSVVVQYDRDLPILKYGTNEESKELFGPKSIVIQDSSIKNPNTAQDILEQKLIDSDPFQRIELKLQGFPDIQPGETVSVVLDHFGLNNQYSCLEADYRFDKNTITSERGIIGLTLSKKFLDVTDKIKELDNRIRRMETQNMSQSDLYSRLFLTKESLNIAGSQWNIYTRAITGSAWHIYSTGFIPPINPFKAASGTGQGYCAGSFTGSASAFGPLTLYKSGT